MGHFDVSSDDIVVAFEVVREWFGTDEAKQKILFGLVAMGDEDRHVRFGKMGDYDTILEKGVTDDLFKVWLKRKIRSWRLENSQHKKKRVLLQPIVWENHYTLLLVREVNSAEVELVCWDPDGVSEKGRQYAIPPLALIQSVVVSILGSTMTIHFAYVGRRGAPQSVTDVFCSVWITWCMKRVYEILSTGNRESLVTILRRRLPFSDLGTILRYTRCNARKAPNFSHYLKNIIKMPQNDIMKTYYIIFHKMTEKQWNDAFNKSNQNRKNIFVRVRSRKRLRSLS